MGHISTFSLSDEEPHKDTKTVGQLAENGSGKGLWKDWVSQTWRGLLFWPLGEPRKKSLGKWPKVCCDPTSWFQVASCKRQTVIRWRYRCFTPFHTVQCDFTSRFNQHLLWVSSKRNGSRDEVGWTTSTTSRPIWKSKTSPGDMAERYRVKEMCSTSVTCRCWWKRKGTRRIIIIFTQIHKRTDFHKHITTRKASTQRWRLWLNSSVFPKACAIGGLFTHLRRTRGSLLPCKSLRVSWQPQLPWPFMSGQWMRVAL